MRKLAECARYHSHSCDLHESQRQERKGEIDPFEQHARFYNVKVSDKPRTSVRGTL